MTVEPTKLNFSQSQPQETKVEATPAPTKLTLAPSPSKPQQPAAPTVTSLHLGNNSSTSASTQLVDEFKRLYADLYQKDAMNIDLLLKQMTPLKIDVVVNWGDASLQHLRTASTDISNLMQTVRSTKASESVQNALDAMQPPTKLFDKLFNKTSPEDYVPAITAARVTLIDILPKSETYLQAIQRVNADIVNRLAVLSTVAQYVGTISDSALDMAFASRRNIFQQAAQQSQIALQQVKDMRDLIVQQKMSVDGFMNVTLPAWKSSKGS